MVRGKESEEEKAEKVDQDAMDWVTVKRRAKPRTQQRTQPRTLHGKQEEEGRKSRKMAQILRPGGRVRGVSPGGVTE